MIERAKPAAQAALDQTMYELRIQRATNAERRYMRAMAELHTGPYRSGDIARNVGRPTTALSPVRQSLLEKVDLRHRGLRPHRLHRPALRRIPTPPTPLPQTPPIGRPPQATCVGSETAWSPRIRSCKPPRVRR